MNTQEGKKDKTLYCPARARAIIVDAMDGQRIEARAYIRLSLQGNVNPFLHFLPPFICHISVKLAIFLTAIECMFQIRFPPRQCQPIFALLTPSHIFVILAVVLISIKKNFRTKSNSMQRAWG